MSYKKHNRLSPLHIKYTLIIKTCTELFTELHKTMEKLPLQTINCGKNE